MNIPEKNKQIEVNGRTFILNKMNAQVGSFMLLKLLKIIKPLFKNINIEKDNFDLSDLNIEELIDGLSDLPEEDFKYIQQNALKVIQEILPGGKPHLLNKYGEFEASNIEDDVALVMNLTIQSLFFNVKGFFPEGILTSLIAKMNTLQQNTEI